MGKLLFIVFVVVLLGAEERLVAQESFGTVSDTMALSGQLSAWAHYNKNSALPLFMGARYIPSLNYSIKLPNEKLIDFEGSLNLFGSLASKPFTASLADATLNPYRAWARYSTRQLEIRVGLQKINFGSATLLRPLMWFDQIDPRDPLKLTNGVWALLGRYYFLNNANLWLWCLYGNNKPRQWFVGNTANNVPEVGGRFQHAIPKGELALSYHFRKVEFGEPSNQNGLFTNVAENRVALDAKWDLDVGLWFEGVWINKNLPAGALTNQEIITLGADYTFDIGNGINVMAEQLLVANHSNRVTFTNNIYFSACSLTYPVGIVDNLSGMAYYDWRNSSIYNFVNWNHNFKFVSLFLMAYLNPQIYQLPQQGNLDNSYSGKGCQVMLVYNY